MDVSAPSPPASPPRVLDRYRLGRRLGSGGFGTVWLARDERLDRDVAVKHIPADKVVPGRGRREALAAARLHHPAIVALYEAEEDDEGTWLVSEWVRGDSLAALLAEGALSDRDVAEIGVALAEGLAHAHAQGVIHRDVKPGNVLVPEALRAGDAPAKLTDFGVAHLADGELLTVTGDVVGTLAYMAPEQAEGRRVTPAADLYALALVLWEALGGLNPVRGATPAVTARRLGTQLPSLARRRPDLPPALVAALDRALLPDPAARGTVEELRAALAAARGSLDDEPGAFEEAPEDAGRRPRPLPSPLSRAWAGTTAGALTAGAMAAWPAAPELPPLAAGLAAGLLVAALPRLGWLLVAGAATAWTAGTGAPGAALVLLLAFAAAALLLPRAPRLWSVPGLAPALGLVGASAAFPALAAGGRTAYRRAALGALGFWWWLLARPLLADPPPGSWPRGLQPALERALASPVAAGELVLAAIWAAAAVLAPLAARRASFSARLLAAGGWAGALALAHAVAAPGHAAPVAGVLAGGAWILLLPGTVRLRAAARERSRAGPVASDLPE